LADAKNYPLMLDALAIVRRSIPASLLGLGEGERGAAIRDYAEALGIADAVVFAGFQRNPWKFIAQADVFALSLRYEGFGNVLIEEMAGGVRVVATASPGTCDIVSDGIDGLLVQQHQPAELAAALERLLTDRALRARMAGAAPPAGECVATAVNRA